MSIDFCERCGDFIDTDYYPESYREEFGDACICDSCWQKMDPDDCIEATEAELFTAGYRVGFERAKFDGMKGHFDPTNYPAESAEKQGYEAFVNSVRLVIRSL